MRKVVSEVDPEMERLVHQYKGTAESIAFQVYRTAPHALDPDELKSIAYLGLVQAAERWLPYCKERGFDPRAEQYFEPFVKRRVRGAVMDALRASDWATRSLRYKSRQLQEAGQDAGASIKEMAERTGLTEDEVRSTVSGMSQRPVSIEGEDLDYAAPQMVEDQVSGNDLLAVAVDTIRELAPEEQVVLALHYYLGEELQNVAATMGITESRASHLHTKSVLAVRAALLQAATEREMD